MCFDCEVINDIPLHALGLFIKNGVRVSSHHAILQGAVSVNGECCKQGSTVLNPGDVVSLKLEQSVPDDHLIAWQGSMVVATKLENEGKNISERKRDAGKRKGRMMPVLDEDEHSNKKSKVDGTSESTSNDNVLLSPFIQYYREKLGHLWKPELHETAMAKPLPLTLRVLKPSDNLSQELVGFGFRRVTSSDFSLDLYNLHEHIGVVNMTLDKRATQELLSNTWIMADEDLYQKNNVKKQQLGVFLSDARISGEIIQQELNSMLPVSILAAVLKNSRRPSNFRVLDLCAAPGSKTCQLLNTLDNMINGADSCGDATDFTVVANELVHQRASRTRTRCFFQGNTTLSHLIVTAGDGREYAKLNENSFEFVVCDVPCSGDGTIRKSPEKLGKWSTANAEKNKSLQKELLRTGLKLLTPTTNFEKEKQRGVLVYSTCSLNPVENDEVIMEVLSELNENGPYMYEIVDLTCLTHCIHAKDKQKGSCMKVLPAASHGGFFVCALRKLYRHDCNVHNMRDEHRSYAADDQLIATKENKLSYAISPCTQQCCIDLMNKSNVQLIGCGVPVLYHESNNIQYILQEGCSSIPLERNDRIPSFDLPCAVSKDVLSAHMDRHIFSYNEMNVSSCENLDLVPGMACTVRTQNATNSLLPAKILHIDDNQNLITVQFTARPQLVKRISSLL